jgi:hypothetical protein
MKDARAATARHSGEGIHQKCCEERKKEGKK